MGRPQRSPLLNKADNTKLITSRERKKALFPWLPHSCHKAEDRAAFFMGDGALDEPAVPFWVAAVAPTCTGCHWGCWVRSSSWLVIWGYWSERCMMGMTSQTSLGYILGWWSTCVYTLLKYKLCLDWCADFILTFMLWFTAAESELWVWVGLSVHCGLWWP